MFSEDQRKVVTFLLKDCFVEYKSIAFQIYYRNTPVLARIHARAMESSDNYRSALAVVTDDEDFKEDEENS